MSNRIGVRVHDRRCSSKLKSTIMPSPIYCCMTLDPSRRRAYDLAPTRSVASMDLQSFLGHRQSVSSTLPRMKRTPCCCRLPAASQKYSARLVMVCGTESRGGWCSDRGEEHDRTRNERWPYTIILILLSRQAVTPWVPSYLPLCCAAAPL